MRRSDANQTKSFHDVRDALSEPGCPVCRLRTKCGDSYLDSLLWESVSDPERREEMRRTQGFCVEHTWRLVRPGGSVGVAIVTRDILQHLLGTLESDSFRDVPRWSLRRLREALSPEMPTAATVDAVAQLTPDGECAACAWVDKMETDYLSALLDNLEGEEGLSTSYRSSDGLCLPHFRKVLALTRGRAQREAMVRAQRAVWRRLTDQLSESLRKSDYRFRHEPRGEEAGSWLRAIAALAGTRPEDE